MRSLFRLQGDEPAGKGATMAFIKIESAEVTRAVGSRGAFQIQEYVTLPDGRTFPKTFTVWQEGEVPTQGAIVQVYGTLSTKVREWTDQTGTLKHVVDVSINEPTVSIIGKPKPASVDETIEAMGEILTEINVATGLPF
jgi:hypothetical protein